MRLSGPGSISTPARILVDALLVVAGFSVAIAAVILAEVFKAGADLQDDQPLTV
jgi:hypothetical protein